MPIAVSYPGVYVQELEPGPGAIVPVATNVAAFVGRVSFGSTEEPGTVFNFGDFTRAYGGLHFDCPMSYAVQDFFMNGGSQAVIARLFEPTPGEGDGVAQLKFPPAAPMLPDGWTLGADSAAGATTLPATAPPGAEGSPEAGMILKLGGDPTTYLVTGYAAADTGKKTPPSLTIAPGLTQSFRRCTALTFKAGSSPAGWTVLGQSQGVVTLTGGTGLPEVGQTVTFGNNPKSFTVVGTASADGTTVKFPVSPAPGPGSIMVGSAATISDPVPLPMPTGWEIGTFAPGSGAGGSQGSITLINGTGAPLPGDQFSMPGAADVYLVTSFTAKTAKADATLAFSSMSQQPLDPAAFCTCCAPVFTRPPPTGIQVKAGPKLNQTQFTVQRGAAATGVIDIGDTFTVGGSDATEYSVRYVDGTTVYFLPPANSAFTSANDLTFYPPLTLAAASPGQWGNYLSATADTNGITPATAKQFAEYDLLAEDLFNLTLTRRDAKGRVVAVEQHRNLSIKTGGAADRFPNRLDRYLKANSNLARVPGALPSTPPNNGATAIGLGGDDGEPLSAATYLGDPSRKTGLYLLDKTHFNLLSIPPDQRFLPGIPPADLDPAVRSTAAEYCTRRRAFYIVDPPVAWSEKAEQGNVSQISPDDLEITGEIDGMEVARNAAVYFPRIWREDILMKSQPALFAPSGAIAGVIASTDVARGIWKAPAGTEAGIAGVQKLEVALNDDENGQLNPLGINCLRNFPVIGPVVWGARTLRGADAFEDAYQYIPVRRLTLFIESSLLAGTQWAVFEPNDEALWSALRLQVGSFLAGLSRQGAFYNYAVKCDATTTTQDDIDRGIVNILVQIAPVKPAEFVVIQIQQIAGASPG